MKQNSNYLFSIRVLIFLALFFQQFSIQFANAQDYSLNNELISLSFGQQGIRSLTDKRLNKTFTFSSDQFLISLNGKIFDSLPAKFEDITATANKLTYTYRIPDFTIKMIYELEEKNFFISKQLEIYPDKNESFRVDQLRLWDIKLEEKLSSYFIPHTKHPKLKTGDYGAFLRFTDATGLF